jgi:hypothetical protein
MELYFSKKKNGTISLTPPELIPEMSSNVNTESIDTNKLGVDKQQLREPP